MMSSLAIKITKIFLSIILLVYCLIWLLSPVASRYFINEVLQPMNLTLAEETSIRYNPFLSQLSIKTLTLHPHDNNNEKLLSLDKLVIRVRLYQLLFDRLSINEFTLDGLLINISQTGKQTSIAGFVLPVTAKDSANLSTETATEAQAETETVPYILDIPELVIKDVVLVVNLPQGQHQLKINKLMLADIIATTTEQQISLELDAEVDQAPLTLVVEALLKGEQGEISTEITLDSFDLKHLQGFLPEDLILHNGLLSYQSRLKLALSKDKIQADFEDMQLNTQALHIEQTPRQFKLAQQSLNSSELALEIAINNTKDNAGNPLTQLRGLAELVLTGAVVYQQNEQEQLMSFADLNINGIALSTFAKKPALAIEKIELTQAIFSDDINTELPPLARISSLNINDLNASASGLAINKISLGAFEVDASLNKDKVLENLIPMNQANSAESSSEQTTKQQAETGQTQQTTEETAQTTTNFALAIKEFVLEEQGAISFVDNSVSPAYQRNFVINTLTAGPVNNQQADIKTQFKLQGRSNKYAKFDVTGFATPFLAEPVYHLEGGINEVNLPGISPYIKDALAYEIQSGQLDLALNVTLTGEIIDGQTDILMRGIELTSADDHQVDSLKDQTAIPFNIALGMLKDSDGNVELEVPLSGNTSSPSFGFTGFLTLLTKQAVMSATKEYLMTTFVPYANVVSITMSAGEYLLKIRFNDLLLSPGETEFVQNNMTFLNEFSALMKDKTDTQVTLCAVATAQDIGLPAGTQEISGSELKMLNELSLNRLNHFKSYMVEQEDIESSRLLLCTPQVDLSAEAKPRLTFAT